MAVGYLKVIRTSAGGWRYCGPTSNVEYRSILTYTNSTGKDIVIKSISLYLGVGSNDIVFDAGDTVVGNGKSFTTHLLINGVKSESQTIEQKIRNRILLDDGRGYPDPYECEPYTFEFTNPVKVLKGGSIEVEIKTPQQYGDNCLCFDSGDRLYSSLGDYEAEMEYADALIDISDATVTFSYKSPSEVLYGDTAEVTWKDIKVTLNGKVLSSNTYTIAYLINTITNGGKKTYRPTITSEYHFGMSVSVTGKQGEGYTGTALSNRSAVTIECKLKPPTIKTLSASSSTVLYGDTTKVTYTIKKATSSPGGTTLNNDTLSLTSSSINPSTLNDGTLTVRSKTTVKSKGPYETKYNYSPSDPAVDKSITVNCKLRPPSLNLSPSTSTGGYTVDLPLVLSLSKNSESPEGITVTNTLEQSTNGTSWSILNKGNDGSYHTSAASGVRFRASTSHGDYVTSSYTDVVTPTVYLEPRNMRRSSGFTCTFGLPRDNNIVYDGEKVTLAWSSFSASKNLGRFNWYQVECQELSSGTWTTISGRTVRGINYPETKKESFTALTVSSDLQGKTLRLVLKCMYTPDNGTNVLWHNDGSAVFVSGSFTVVAKPTVTLLYPTSSWKSANLQSRLIFKVSGHLGVSDISVTVSIVTPSRSAIVKYTAKTTPDYFKSVDRQQGPPYSDSTILDFTIPEVWSDNAVATITCTDSHGVESSPVKTPSYEYCNLSYVVEGQFLLSTVANSLIVSTKEIVNGYRDIASDPLVTPSVTLWEGISRTLNSATEVDKGSTVVSSSFRYLLGALGLLYVQVLENYSIPPSSVIPIDFSKLNTEDLQDITIDAFSPPFFIVNDSHYTPVGNYFNYIIYILKFML